MKGSVQLEGGQVQEAVALWVERNMRGARLKGAVRIICPGPPDPPYASPGAHRIEVEVEYPPASWCGMRSHDWDCECGGTGGDR